MQIYVGNLAPETTEKDLEEAFKPFGQVGAVEVKREMFSGVSRGFGFVEMPGRQHSLNAIAGLNGKELRGQIMRVNESRPRMGRR